MIGEKIEYKNAKKGENQRGIVKDKVTIVDRYNEENKPVTITGYLVEEEITKTFRIVKPTRILRII